MRTLFHVGTLLIVVILSNTAQAEYNEPYLPGAEASARARKFGIDYASMYTAAWNHKEALASFLSLAAHDIFDAASTDDYCYNLFCLMQKHGDKNFAAALQSFTEPIRAQIRDDLQYAEPRYEQKFSITARLAAPRSTYEVRKVDTLGQIARRLFPQTYQAALPKIVALNHLESPDSIRTGAILILP